MEFTENQEFEVVAAWLVVITPGVPVLDGCMHNTYIGPRLVICEGSGQNSPDTFLLTSGARISANL